MAETGYRCDLCRKVFVRFELGLANHKRFHDHHAWCELLPDRVRKQHKTFSVLEEPGLPRRQVPLLTTTTQTSHKRTFGLADS